MTVMEVVIGRTDATNPVVAALCSAQQAELAEHYPDPHPTPAVHTDVAFVVAYTGDGEPVGCAGVQPVDPAVAELKRLYVVPAQRGQGISRRLLRAAECLATELGHAVVRLETGVRQTEAIGLYRSSGYARIGRYGPYVGAPFSVCFEKSLTLVGA